MCTLKRGKILEFGDQRVLTFSLGPRPNEGEVKINNEIVT